MIVSLLILSKFWPGLLNLNASNLVMAWFASGRQVTENHRQVDPIGGAVRALAVAETHAN
jgi:hypothetical protein